METIKNMVFGKQEVETATPAYPLWDTEKNMKCLIWNGKETVEYVAHARPKITAPTDILLKVTATTICGSDLHMYKGTFTGMKPRDIIGHEFMGLIEEVGNEVTKLKVGQRVVVGFAIACGDCDFCKRKEYTACDRTNPSRLMEKEYSDRLCGVYGYSHYTGGIPGGQAEYVRVAFAEFNCLRLPDSVPDEKALYLTDIIPTSYHGVVNGEVDESKTVGIWGLGPIGLMTAQWCKVLGARRIIGIDCEPERIALARDHLGIEVINFKEVDDVVKTVENLIGGHLDVGIEAAGFSFAQSWSHKLQMKLGLETDTSEIFCEMFRAVRKFGNISIIGDYFGYANHFPVGAMMEKAFTIRSGQDPLQKYWKHCLEKVESGEIDPTFLITHRGTLADGPRFYKMMNDQELIKCFMRPEHLTP